MNSNGDAYIDDYGIYNSNMEFSDGTESFRFAQSAWLINLYTASLNNNKRVVNVAATTSIPPESETGGDTRVVALVLGDSIRFASIRFNNFDGEGYRVVPSPRASDPTYRTVNFKKVDSITGLAAAANIVKASFRSANDSEYVMYLLDADGNLYLETISVYSDNVTHTLSQSNIILDNVTTLLDNSIFAIKLNNINQYEVFNLENCLPFENLTDYQVDI